MAYRNPRRDEPIPVMVEHQIDRDGNKTGKYHFLIDNLFHYYEFDYDPVEMDYLLEENGFDRHELRQIGNDMQKAFDELNKAEKSKPAPRSSKKEDKVQEPIQEPIQEPVNE